MKSEYARKHPRDAAVTIKIDLRQSDQAIHAALRVRYPQVIDLNCELARGPNPKSGWVYNRNRVLAKLVQS